MIIFKYVFFFLMKKNDFFRFIQIPYGQFLIEINCFNLHYSAKSKIFLQKITNLLLDDSEKKQCSMNEFETQLK